MTKKELRNQQLNRHYASLDNLAILTGCKLTGKKLSLHLLRIEKHFSQINEKYCNGVMDFEEAEKHYDYTKTEIMLLMPELKGFYLNTDPRGYSLKIDTDKIKDAELREKYLGLGLQRDWGNYLLLSPEIN